MMWKTKKLFLLLLPIAIGAVLFGCVEEPTIAPAPVPYTSLRIGNFTTNIDGMRVKIFDTDGSVAYDATLASEAISNWFDVTSGTRLFEVYDDDGNVIYNKSITVLSYEEETIYFTGFTSTVDTLNSFNPVVITEGFVYLKEAPPADSAWVNVLNFVTDSPTSIARDIDYTVGSADTLVSQDTLTGTISYGDQSGAQLKAGLYNHAFADTSDENVNFVIEGDVNFTGGMRYYLLISGEPGDFKVLVDEQQPLPVRPK